MLCDDLRTEPAGDAVSVTHNGCARSRALFSQALGRRPGCQVEGQPASLPQAIEHAGKLLQFSALPLFLCAGTDVATMRALLALADSCAAVVDHASEGLMRNLLVLQDSGWIATTLTEIRNRADLILCVGTDVVSRFPRFFERCGLGGGMFDEKRQAPEVIFLGATPPEGMVARHIGIQSEELAELFAQLRALHAGKQPQRLLPQVMPLMECIQRANYGVAVWSAADFGFPHAELTIQALCEWVKDLNQMGRFACLPLGGNGGDITAHQVTTWQSGSTLRTRFTSTGPQYDPFRYSSRRLLESGEADLLLYVDEFGAAAQVSAHNIPSIVLGRAGTTPPPSQVFIPMGTPGIDRDGHLFRTDNVVAVPLKKLVDRNLHSAPEVLRAIAQHLARRRA
ncbi:MAG: hypothetical protein ACKVQA_17940 [Burkholderiales bacterium]